MNAITDTLLTPADQKAELSLVYAQAVAARAGCATSIPTPDRDSIDLSIQAGGAMRPALDLQLKATTTLSTGGRLSFDLPRRNYDHLRIETQTPRLLLVLQLPRDEEQWMTISAQELTLRGCAYWLSLRGFEESANRRTVTVSIPTANVFDVQALQQLMEQSRKGRIQ